MTIRNPGIWERVLVWLSTLLSNLARGVENAAFEATWKRVNPGEDYDAWLDRIPETFAEPGPEPDVRDELLADTEMRSQVLIMQNLDRAGLFADTDGDALFARDNPGQVR